MTGVVPLIPRFKFTDALGVPIVGGTVTVYLAGTTTLANTYQDQGLTIANTNPVTLDANGECLFWVDSAYSYKLLLKDDAGVTVTGWPVDNIPGGANVGAAAQIAADWATKTDAPVSGSLYSSKEYAQGTQASTGGSAKNWAQQTGADVTGATANSRSAKSWAQDNLTGVTLGGSAKDWAQSASSPDGTSKSAKSYATDAQTASAAALAATRVFADTTAGLAGTTNGQYFYVISGVASESLLLYLNSAGTAVLQKRYPSTSALFDASKYAGSVSSKAGVFTGRNLFNPATINSGFFQDATNGTLNANALFFVTDYIPVVPGTTVVCSHATPVASANAFAYFDYALSYVSGSSAQLAANTTTTVPANAAYIRLTFKISDVPTAALMICLGAAVPSSYVGFAEMEALPVLTKARTFDLAIRPKRENLYDADKRVTGHFIQASDGTSQAGTAFHTDYIPVTPGGAWTIFPASSGVVAPGGLAYYDRNFSFVSGTTGPFTSGQVFAVPATAWYVRVTANNSQANTLVILDGSQVPVDSQYHMPAFMSDAWQWHGKQITVLGDSLSDPAMNATFGLTTDWPTAVAAAIGATVGLRAAKSGRTMVNALKDSSDVALNAASFTSIDLAIMLLGTNDYGTAATPIGTISDSTATASYYGYTKKAIEQILTWKPTIKFAICTLTPRADVTAANAAGAVLADYSTALRAIANLYRIPIIDLEKVCGLNSFNFSTWTADNLHFNQAGQIACLQGPILSGLRTVWPNT